MIFGRVKPPQSRPPPLTPIPRHPAQPPRAQAHTTNPAHHQSSQTDLKPKPQRTTQSSPKKPFTHNPKSITHPVGIPLGIQIHPHSEHPPYPQPLTHPQDLVSPRSITSSPHPRIQLRASPSPRESLSNTHPDTHRPSQARPQVTQQLPPNSMSLAHTPKQHYLNQAYALTLSPSLTRPSTRKTSPLQPVIHRSQNGLVMQDHLACFLLGRMPLRTNA